MAAQLRGPPQAARERRRLAFNQLLRASTTFTLADVRRCLWDLGASYTVKEAKTIFKNAQLPLFTQNPLLTLRNGKTEMKFCLQHGNVEAHFVEGVKQLFVFNDSTKGMKHLRISANGHYELGNYLYAILLLITGEHKKGMEYLDRSNWKTNVAHETNLWNRLKRCLRDVPILQKPTYGLDMMLIMPTRRCETHELDDGCMDCFYYKQMEEFMELINIP